MANEIIAQWEEFGNVPQQPQPPPPPDNNALSLPDQFGFLEEMDNINSLASNRFCCCCALSGLIQCFARTILSCSLWCSCKRKRGSRKLMPEATPLISSEARNTPTQTLDSKELEDIKTIIPFASLEFHDDINGSIDWLRNNPALAYKPEYGFEKFIVPAMARLGVRKVLPLLDAFIGLNLQYDIKITFDVFQALRYDPYLGALFAYSQPEYGVIRGIMSTWPYNQTTKFLENTLDKCTTCEPWDSGIQHVILSLPVRKLSLKLWSIQYVKDKHRLEETAT